MTPQTEQLINEHTTILTLLRKIKKEKLSSDERNCYLLTVKSLLFNHLKEEDQEIYPLLKEWGQTRSNIQGVVEEFTVGLNQIGILISSFFEKTEKNPNNIHTDSDFSKIIKLLEIRISKEEKGLYPIYDENIGSAPISEI